MRAMKKCNACGRSVPENLIADSNRHNIGGDTICLPCHIECITSGWQQLPADAGQIVDLTYAVDWESRTLYRRSADRSDRSVEIESAEIVGGNFEPWNGILPEHGEWQKQDADNDIGYQIAFVLEATGEFEVVETFHAADDQAANDYAEYEYGDRPWYVLDSSGRNINGGPHQGN